MDETTSVPPDASGISVARGSSTAGGNPEPDVTNLAARFSKYFPTTLEREVVSNCPLGEDTSITKKGGRKLDFDVQPNFTNLHI